MADAGGGRRRWGGGSLGVTVLAGLAGGIAAAVAGNQAWVEVSDAAGSSDAAFASSLSTTSDGAPAVTATALVVLASWGVVLVTRGLFRRVVLGVCLLAAVATAGFAVAAWLTQPDDVADRLRSLEVVVSRTTWSYLGVLGGLLATGAAVDGFRGVRRWPEMGGRYDAPVSGSASSAAVPDDDDSLGLWKALDEGRDPTDLPGDEPDVHH